MPIGYDFPIWIGSSGRLIWPIPFDPAGYSFGWRFETLTGVTPAFELRLKTEGGGLFVHVSSRMLIWPHEPPQTRLFPPGRYTRTEIQSISPDGTQTPELYGYVTGRGGLNDD